VSQQVRALESWFVVGQYVELEQGALEYSTMRKSAKPKDGDSELDTGNPKKSVTAITKRYYALEKM